MKKALKTLASYLAAIVIVPLALLCKIFRRQ